MAFWDINERGFLPAQDPTAKGHSFLIEFAGKLPELLEKRCWREEVVYFIRSFRYYNLLVDADEVALETLFRTYSYFASAYVFATYETPAKRIPKEIAAPLVMLSEKLNRKPILSYASYCLNNWRRKDAFQPIELGNIELIQNFSHPDHGRRDEDWFILVHVDIEDKASTGVTAIKQFLDGEITSVSCLEKIHSSLERMNKTLDRMPEQCSPDVYYVKVRPYIFGFNGITYESCFNNEPQSFRGETGAQSSIVPAFQTILGIKHKESMLTTHLRDMRQYMPLQHREFLDRIESSGLCLRDEKNGRELYNSCLREFIRFRETHLRYAIEYIQKRVENPTGTGGTPYIPWLSQLIKETEEYLL